MWKSYLRRASSFSTPSTRRPDFHTVRDDEGAPVSWHRSPRASRLSARSETSSSPCARPRPFAQEEPRADVRGPQADRQRGRRKPGPAQTVASATCAAAPKTPSVGPPWRPPRRRRRWEGDCARAWLMTSGLPSGRLNRFTAAVWSRPRVQLDRTPRPACVRIGLRALGPTNCKGFASRLQSY